MSTGTVDPTDDDPVALAVCEYLSARDNGRPISAADWLGRHPDLAAELESFLEDLPELEVLGLVGRGGVREPDLATDERFLGDYELAEKLGGNMGLVYRARQLSLPREVAIKLLARPGETNRARFRTEAEAMARLHHPHVARILDVSRDDGPPFFSLEWYAGGSLDRRLAEYPGDPAKAAAVVEQVSRAVHFAHQRGVLHRDLKPANVLLDEAGRPYVADFGLAVVLADGPAADRGMAGTPAFMAPEQLDGEVTVATDVHGLGALLFALLTGRPPFGGPRLTDVMNQVRSTAPCVGELNPRIDADLQAVCHKCLAKDPAKRYPSAEALADDLKRWQEGEAVEARPLGPLGRIAHVVRQARAAADFRGLGPGLVAQALIAFGTNAAVWALLTAGAAEAWAWLAVFASYGPLFAFLVMDWRQNCRRNPAGRRHLWSVTLGHAAACIAVFVALRLAAPDPVHGFGTGYVACAAINALAFAAMGSLLAGRMYLFTAVWIAAAVGMALALPAAPLVYAVLIGACSLLTGLQLRGLREPEAGTHSETVP